MNFTHQTGFYFFRILMPAVILLIQIFLYFRATRWLNKAHPRWRWARTLKDILFPLFNLSLVAVIVWRPNLQDISPWFRYGAMYPFYIWHTATLFTGLILVLIAVAKLPFQVGLWLLRRISSVRTRILRVTSRPAFLAFDKSRRRFLRQATGGLVVVSFAGAGYGAFRGRSGYELTEASFTIPGLPPEFEGFTVGLVSDVHSSIFMTRGEMEEYVTLLNELKTDLVVVPGDFVNGQTAEVYPFCEAFSKLRAPYGVFGVLGNHDFYAQEPDIVAREVNACGVRLLRNEGVFIRKNGAELHLSGIDDASGPASAKERMKSALEGVPASIPRILLSHRPYFLPQAAELNIGLVLSGHTHGGQVVLAQLGRTALTPATLFSPYVAGEYSKGATHMYVSRGLGTVGLPIRINCPPEVTRITLSGSKPS
jgi:predicted MPP superfamily phosphohydrolase